MSVVSTSGAVDSTLPPPLVGEGAVPVASLAAVRRADALRPTRLAEFHGQPRTTKELGIVLRAARERGELPGHLAFVGPPGLGKTTLAQLVATELGVGLRVSSGPALEHVRELAELLVGLSGPTVVFLDEIHRLPRVVEEALYPALEDGVFDLTVPKGNASTVVRIPLEPFTLVAATTQLGMVSAPLRSRFRLVMRLRPYSVPDLQQIVVRSGGLLGVTLTEQAAHVIAARSQGVARLANNHLQLVRDYGQAHGLAVLDEDVALAALATFGIDERGLDRTSHDFLRVLAAQFNGGPAGLGAIAAVLGESPLTLAEACEPYLLQLGLVVRTPRGRVLTEAGSAVVAGL